MFYTTLIVSIIVLVGVLFCDYGSKEMAKADALKLELVQVLFRHGARTCNKAEAFIPMPAHVDKNLHETYDYEQLTNIGKAQAYKLGCALRERYGNFLGNVYRPREVYAYSSDFDRTKMSLQLVLAGLYPPPPEQKWNPDLNWMPVPSHYMPRPMDALLQSFRKSKYQQLLQEVKSSPVNLETDAKLTKLNNFLKEKGIDAIEKYKFVGCMGIYNVLSVHKASKASLPDWYTDELLDELRECVVEFLDIMSLTTEMKKLNGGPLLRRFIENMDIEGQYSNPRKIYLYSGHELNIAAFTRAHNIQEFKYPDYSSAVIVEKLRDSENKLYVKIIGWTGKGDGFKTLRLENCDDACPIDKYLEITKEVTPSDETLSSIVSDMDVDLQDVHTSDFVYKAQVDVRNHKFAF